MTSPSADVVIDHFHGEEARSLLGELCDAYGDAYGVEPTTDKTSAFRDRALQQIDRPGFDLVTARDDRRLVGFALGYTLTADTRWWDGLQPAAVEGFSTEHGSRTFVLSEIEVRRAWQSKGVGRALHDALMQGRPEERATLATGPDASSRAVYESWGWQRVGRVPGVDGDYYSAYDLFVISLPSGPRP
jgi:GNAT superfamily N-acetyltransferase